MLTGTGWQQKKEREWAALGCEETEKAWIEKQVRARETQVNVMSGGGHCGHCCVEHTWHHVG
jgi:hypothetical protein